MKARPSYQKKPSTLVQILIVAEGAVVNLLDYLLMVEAAVKVSGALATWVVVGAQSALYVLSLIQRFQVL